MDIDIIRDQKLGAGAGVRSNKVRGFYTCLCVCVGAEQIALQGNIAFLLEAKSIADHYIITDAVSRTGAKMTEPFRRVVLGFRFNWT